MQLVNTESYKTTIFSFEDEHGNDFKVIHNESYDDIFTTEWIVYNDEEEITENDYYYETLITLAKNKLYENHF